IQHRRQHRIPTAQLNEVLLPALERTPPPAVRGRDLRINYVTQTGVAPPLFVFFTNFPDLVPDHYKRYIERTLRELFPLEGVPISLVFRRK
ncbi:MAG: ribosome biogenesis GTPase Der, partial [Chlorobi bacterium]|nr:ribosome biogenesis GTPase Der [Chlorobiota bacterium]